MSDFDAFEMVAAFFIVLVGAVQVIAFSFVALKRLGRRSRSDDVRSRGSIDRPSSIRLH